MVPEALKILESLDERQNPDVVYFKFAALFSQWRYEDALPIVERFVSLVAEDPYRHLLGRIKIRLESKQ